MKKVTIPKPDQVLLSMAHRDQEIARILADMDTELATNALRRTQYLSGNQPYAFLMQLCSRLEAVNQKARFLIDPEKQLLQGGRTLKYKNKDTETLSGTLENALLDLGMLKDALNKLYAQTTYPWHWYGIRLCALISFVLGDAVLNFIGLEYTGIAPISAAPFALLLATLLIPYKLAIGHFAHRCIALWKQTLVQIGGYVLLLIIFGAIAYGRYNIVQKVQSLEAFEAALWCTFFVAVNIVLFGVISYMIEHQFPDKKQWEIRKQVKKQNQKIITQEQVIEELEKQIPTLELTARSSMQMNLDLLTAYNEFIKETRDEYRKLVAQFKGSVANTMGAIPACFAQSDPEFRIYPIILKNNQS